MTCEGLYKYKSISIFRASSSEKRIELDLVNCRMTLWMRGHFVHRILSCSSQMSTTLFLQNPSTIIERIQDSSTISSAADWWAKVITFVVLQTCWCFSTSWLSLYHANGIFARSSEHVPHIRSNLKAPCIIWLFCIHEVSMNMNYVPQMTSCLGLKKSIKWTPSMRYPLQCNRVCWITKLRFSIRYQIASHHPSRAKSKVS